MKVVRNSLNYDFTSVSGEVFTKKSLTIPDATMSLRELLDRYARGLPVNGSEPVYHGDEVEIPNLKAMDLTEIHELKEATANEVSNLRNKAQSESAVKRADKEAKQKKKQSLFDRVEKMLEREDAKSASNE